MRLRNCGLHSTKIIIRTSTLSSFNFHTSYHNNTQHTGTKLGIIRNFPTESHFHTHNEYNKSWGNGKIGATKNAAQLKSFTIFIQASWTNFAIFLYFILNFTALCFFIIFLPLSLLASAARDKIFLHIIIPYYILVVVLTKFSIFRKILKMRIQVIMPWHELSIHKIIQLIFAL
jgi:hypothetical protein